MICLGILWNSMQEYSQEAMDDISKYCKIDDGFTIKLDNDYEKFVRDIYSCDEIADWKVDKKIETMFQCTENRNVIILFLDIETSKMSYHIFKKRMVYEDLENMKKDIREKYSQIVPNYFFDNVFHVTDDENEYAQDYDVVMKYVENHLTENIFSKNKIKLKSKK